MLKPEEKTKPSVAYRGHKNEIEAKIPKGHLHDRYSYADLILTDATYLVRWGFDTVCSIRKIAHAANA